MNPTVFAKKGKPAIMNLNRAHMEQKAMKIDEEGEDEGLYQNSLQKSLVKVQKSKKMK
jgi:hypothetical protein